MGINRSRLYVFGVLLALVACTVDDPSIENETDANLPPQDVQISPPKQVKIGTFNVKAFFDPICDSGRCSPRSYEAQPTESEFEAKARQLARGIEALDADVVLLQEVEKNSCLEAIQAALSEEYATAVIGETNAIASLDVGVIARLPLIETFSYVEEPIPLIGQRGMTYFEREFFEVHFDLDGERLIVFNAHFRSKNNDNPAQRLAEATAAHQIVTARIREFPDASQISCLRIPPWNHSF